MTESKEAEERYLQMSEETKKATDAARIKRRFSITSKEKLERERITKVAMKNVANTEYHQKVKKNC